MPNQSTPEIRELQRLALHRPDEMVFVEDAIQAVRDTEDRIGAEVITDPFAGREDEIRREAVREIVDALRARAAEDYAGRGSWSEAVALVEHFLTTDNPEGNA